jgi:hypothetical protein
MPFLHRTKIVVENPKIENRVLLDDRNPFRIRSCNANGIHGSRKIQSSPIICLIYRTKIVENENMPLRLRDVEPGPLDVAD